MPTVQQAKESPKEWVKNMGDHELLVRLLKYTDAQSPAAYAIGREVVRRFRALVDQKSQ